MADVNGQSDASDGPQTSIRITIQITIHIKQKPRSAHIYHIYQLLSLLPPSPIRITIMKAAEMNEALTSTVAGEQSRYAVELLRSAIKIIHTDDDLSVGTVDGRLAVGWVDWGEEPWSGHALKITFVDDGSACPPDKIYSFELIR